MAMNGGCSNHLHATLGGPFGASREFASGPRDAQADVREPFGDGCGNTGVALEGVSAGDAGDRAVRTLGRCPERVVLALDHEGRDVHSVQLGEAALFGAARRMEGKREAQDGDRPGLGSGPTRDPRAQRSTAGREGEPVEWADAKLRDD
jgi:hypothetical protein